MDTDENEHNFEDAPLGYKFKQINGVFMRLANEQLGEDGITFSQMAVLFYITKNGDHKISQKEICEATQVKHPTMVGLLSRMEDKGLIIQVPDPDNRKYKVITLTEQAKLILRTKRERHAETDRNIIRGFTAEEVKELNVLLTQVYRNLAREAESAANVRVNAATEDGAKIALSRRSKDL